MNAREMILEFGEVTDALSDEKYAKVEKKINQIVKALEELHAREETATQDYQVMERKLEERTSALNDVRTYLSSIESNLVRTREMFDAGRQECERTLNVIEDALNYEGDL